MLQIEAPPGKFPIRVELVNPRAGKVTAKNFRISKGIARITPDGVLEVPL
jgi:hypothetical protein